MSTSINLVPDRISATPAAEMPVPVPLVRASKGRIGGADRLRKPSAKVVAVEPQPSAS